MISDMLEPLRTWYYRRSPRQREVIFFIVFAFCGLFLSPSPRSVGVIPAFLLVLSWVFVIQYILCGHPLRIPQLPRDSRTIPEIFRDRSKVRRNKDESLSG